MIGTFSIEPSMRGIPATEPLAHRPSMLVRSQGDVGVTGRGGGEGAGVVESNHRALGGPWLAGLLPCHGSGCARLMPAWRKRRDTVMHAAISTLTCAL